MSLYAKISCGNCGHSFELYHSSMNDRENPMRCPHCLQKMDEKHWENLIDAFYTAHDWNYQCLKAHTEHNSPMFTAEFMCKNVPRDKICLD